MSAEIAKTDNAENVPAVVNENLPAFMQQDAAVGMETINEISTPPYLKIVQAQSQALQEKGFNIGDIVLMPAESKMDEKLTVTPVLNFTQYQLLNPREVETLPMVRESTLDADTELAQKCKNMEVMPCPESPTHECKYQSSSVMIVYVHEIREYATLLFKGAEWKTVRQWANKIKLLGASIYAGKYVLCSENHKNTKGTWKGYSISSDGYVDEPTYNQLKAQHQIFVGQMDKFAPVTDDELDLENQNDKAQADRDDM